MSLGFGEQIGVVEPHDQNVTSIPEYSPQSRTDEQLGKDYLLVRRALQILEEFESDEIDPLQRKDLFYSSNKISLRFTLIRNELKRRNSK